ncbi:glycosyltransferase family 2 protein [Mangrovibacterium sp.]|uniref:glycosyltransferase family 2 protein n=1 Tax=Mangrovibacterium sp. TaxID=1961364 RepID=UPI0035664563
MNISVLLTCYNRKAYTTRVLESLFKLKQTCDIFLVDDGSSDGTSKAIKEMFPQVVLLNGTGDLFWNRGMHLAWKEASKNDYDFYIWLNDDVFLYEEAFNELIECSTLQKHKALVSGIIESEDKCEVLYGGTNASGLIHPNGEMNPIKNLNGNAVLIPRYVFEQLGNLDPIYHHDLGDVDYGLRATAKGIGVYTTRKAIASGTKNDLCRVRKNNTNLIGRFKKLYSPLGSHPGINFYFRRKHYGLFKASAFVLYLYLINILPDIAIHWLFGNKYD